MSKYGNNPITRLAKCRRSAGETIVQSGLAVTPAQMLEMAQAGIPISSVNADHMYRDGYRDPGDVPTLDMQRGVDIGDLWENHMSLREKMRKLRKMHPDTQPSEPSNPQ